MDSSNKDIIFDCILLSELVDNNYCCFAQLYQSSRWVAIRPTVLSTARLGPVCLITGDPSGFGGPSPRLLPPLCVCVWGYCLAPEAPLLRGNADGAQGHFRKYRVRVNSGPAPGSSLKMPCAVFLGLVGRIINIVGCK